MDEAISWLTGLDAAELQHHLDAGTMFRELFAAAHRNRSANAVRGVIFFARVEGVEDAPLKKIRILDKLADKIASGRPMAQVLRATAL